ncbi:MAG: lipopolysaccharide biosynthesis protein [Paludibacteraceae bacterium]|nr:lipopolysaccharide biosynthesis protein [Paludibacteraceae bacterium]
MSESIKDKTSKGLLWSAVERFSVQGIQFLVMLVMARILTPDDYGLVGMAAIFIAIANSLIDSGFSQALIRKQNRTDVDKSTVFYFNIVVSVVLYGIIFVVAPFVSDFYKMPSLTWVVRMICLACIVNSFGVVQRAEFFTNMDFKSLTISSLIASIISGFVGIYMALYGYGVRALVVQQVISAVVSNLVLWFLSKWRPLLVFSEESFDELFSFGSKLMLSGLLDTAYKQIYPIVIGKLFSASSLGNYNRACHFAQFPSSNLTSIMQRVTYPVLCSIQNEDDRLRDIYRKFLKVSAFVVFPLMMLLSALSFPMVDVLIGEKWRFCSELLQIICFAMMWYPIHAINLNLLQVKGRSDLFLKLEIIKKILGIFVLVASAPFGLIAMCYARIGSSIIGLMINTYYTGKLISMGFLKQMKDLMPTLMLSGVMFVVVLQLTHLIENQILTLIIGCVVGLLVYLVGSMIFKFQELQDVKALVRKK